MEANILEAIERIIETPYIESPYETGSVCLENDDELRAEFILQFTIYDVVNYVYGVLYQLYWKENKEIESVSLLKIPYPINATFFWEYSFIGKKIRVVHPIQEMEFISLNELNWERV